MFAGFDGSDLALTHTFDWVRPVSSYKGLTHNRSISAKKDLDDPDHDLGEV